MGERPLLKLGQHVAELQDREPGARLDRDAGRARLLAADLPVERLERRPARRLGVVLAMAAALSALLLVLVMRPHDPLSFELGGPEVGVVGAWIAAPPREVQPIRFSDGSVLRLAPGGRARVTAVDRDGAEIALERGTLDVAVVHREHTRWTVRVGPFQVHVIGTRFDVVWDPVTEQLDVALREGAITVSGPIVGESRAVRAGERLTISTTRSTLEVSAIDGARADVPTAPATRPPAPVDPPAEPPSPLPSNPGAAAPTPSSVAAPSAPAVASPSVTAPGATVPSVEPPSAPTPSPGSTAAPTAPAPAEPAAVPAPAPDWRALALNARYKEALAAAELTGFDALCSTLNVSDLQSLSYAARLGGSGTRAVQALTTLRRRFPGSAEAGAAAFMLGRMAQDGARDHAGAASWFNRYLAEQPSGAFAAEAAGRLVEAQDKMGDDAGARRAATRYLTLYPGGPHAGYARGVLARAPPVP